MKKWHKSGLKKAGYTALVLALLAPNLVSSPALAVTTSSSATAGSTTETTALETATTETTTSEASVLQDDALARGTFGTSPWSLSADHILTIGAGTFAETKGTSPWLAYKDQIKTIVFTDEVVAGADISSLFAGLTQLTNIQNLQLLDVRRTTKMDHLFSGNTQLTTLDLSQWRTQNLAENEGIFADCPNLEKITLGAASTFKATTISEDSTAHQWSGGSSQQTFSSLADLVTNYTGETPDSFVKTEKEILGQVTVNYLDENDQVIHEAQVIEGSVNSEYHLDSYKLPIDGYVLDETRLPANGRFTEASQAVTFYYKKVNVEARAAAATTAAPSVSYSTHIQTYAWQGYKKDGATGGTTGEAKRLEAIKIKLDAPGISGGIQYKTHIQTYGWESSFKENNQISGTSGQAKRLEAIQIKLTGELAKQYDVYYRVHAQSFGWLDWAKNGESSGTAGFAYRLEGIQIKLVKKGAAAPGATTNPFYSQPSVSYQTHIQTYGWEKTAKQNGAVSGTTGQAKRLEAIKINITDQTLSGGIQYQTHIQSYGWEKTAKQNGAVSGTSGQAKRLEAIRISLTGELAKHFDVYYRVHSQNFGWMGWAKNGQNAGTEGYAYRLEGIQIRILRKGASAPGTTAGAFKKYSKPKEIFLSSVPYVSQYTPVKAPWGCAAASMTMLLRSKGVKVDLRAAQDNLPMYPQYAGGQKGNVYTGYGFGWVITPGTLTDYMKRWYPNVRNISGYSADQIVNEILKGKPVLYYGYSSYQVDTVRNHCKVIAGYKNGQFLVYDPLYYSASSGPGTGGGNMKYDRGAMHWLPMSNFKAEYNKKAIVID